MLVNGAAVDGDYWRSHTGEWCFTAQTSKSVLAIAGAHIDLPDVQARTVDDWTAYGVDLGSPQVAAAIGNSAARIRGHWEHLDDTI